MGDGFGPIKEPTMKDSVSFERWRIVQDFAHKEWTTDPNLIKNEFEEARRKYQKVITEIERKYNFRNDWDILDLGCGPTLVGRLFTKGNLIGLDPLVDELKIQQLYPNVKLVDGRGEELPFKDESFDVVFCRNVVDHSQSPKKIVLEAHRVLRKNGLLFLACYVYNPFIAAMKFLADRTGIDKNIGHPFTLTPRSFRDLVAGKFEIAEETTIHTGLNPHDYGKIDGSTRHWSLAYDITLFLNFKILRYSWFVKEILLIGRKKC